MTPSGNINDWSLHHSKMAPLCSVAHLSRSIFLCATWAICFQPGNPTSSPPPPLQFVLSEVLAYLCSTIAVPLRKKHSRRRGKTIGLLVKLKLQWSFSQISKGRKLVRWVCPVFLHMSAAPDLVTCLGAAPWIISLASLPAVASTTLLGWQQTLIPIHGWGSNWPQPSRCCCGIDQCSSSPATASVSGGTTLQMASIKKKKKTNFILSDLLLQIATT